MLPELQFLHLIILLIVPSSCYPANDKELAPIHWKYSNFKARQSSDLDVYVGDKIDIICPFYTVDTPLTEWEYYVVYLVSKPEYEDCIVYSPHNVSMIVNCSSPTDIPELKGTMLFMEFQGIPGMPDFKPGFSYYLTTTSKGSRSGISNQVEGACKERNMRLKINVHPTPATKRPRKTTTESPRRTSKFVPTRRKTPRTTTRSRTTTLTTTSVETSSTMRPTTPWSPKDSNYDTDKDLRENPAKDTIILADEPGNSGTINSSERQSAPRTLLILFCSILLTAHVIQR